MSCAESLTGNYLTLFIQNIPSKQSLGQSSMIQRRELFFTGCNNFLFGAGIENNSRLSTLADHDIIPSGLSGGCKEDVVGRHGPHVHADNCFLSTSCVCVYKIQK